MTSILVLSEAADVLRVSRWTLLRWVKAGKIRHVRYAGKIVFRLEDVEAFLSSRTFGPHGVVPFGREDKESRVQ